MGERVEGCKRKYAGGGTSSGYVQEDFGRENAGQNGKYGDLKKVQGGKGSKGM